MKDPATSAEWREAVNLAELYLRVDAARQYGIVSGGPQIDVGRCTYILTRGQALGYRPNELEVMRLARALGG